MTNQYYGKSCTPNLGGAIDVYSRDEINRLLSSKIDRYSAKTIGVYTLASVLEVQNGLSQSKLVTPYTLQSKLSNSVTSTSTTTIASSSAVKQVYDLANNAQPKDNDLTAIAGLTGTSGLLTKTATDTWDLVALNTYATTSSPSFIGTPLAPTAAVGTNNTQIATTAFVANGFQPKDNDLTAIAGLTGTSGLLKKTATDTWSLDTNTYATTSSPSFTGTPLAPTAAVGTNNTQIATTAFVQSAVSGGSGEVISSFLLMGA